MSKPTLRLSPAFAVAEVQPFVPLSQTLAAGVEKAFTFKAGYKLRPYRLQIYTTLTDVMIVDIKSRGKSMLKFGVALPWESYLNGEWDGDGIYFDFGPTEIMASDDDNPFEVVLQSAAGGTVALLLTTTPVVG